MHVIAVLKSDWWMASRGHHALLFALGVALVLGLGGLDDSFWRHERSAVFDGEWWRLLTGQWFHTTFLHALWNALGLVLVGWLLGPVWRVGEWLIIGLAASATVGVGLLLHMDIEWYLGLSGLLHGLFVAGAIGLLLKPDSAGARGRSGEGGVLLVLLVGKLFWEQMAGPLPGSEAATEGAVIVEAHLYGALGGLLAALGLRLFVPPDVPHLKR